MPLELTIQCYAILTRYGYLTLTGARKEKKMEKKEICKNTYLFYFYKIKVLIIKFA